MRSMLSKARSLIGVSVGGLLAMLLIAPSHAADRIAHVGLLNNGNPTASMASVEEITQ